MEKLCKGCESIVANQIVNLFCSLKLFLIAFKWLKNMGFIFGVGECQIGRANLCVKHSGAMNSVKCRLFFRFDGRIWQSRDRLLTESVDNFEYNLHKNGAVSHQL
ncbi:hypothetical protein [Thalassolituus marinus]|uniref:Uncharacterized protein n=1 Tax=Thalassolituus marinus TaxID=671053 RepID=A0ABS7ZKA9_9GAMM|nr:hypothetical protein [Thalassolituus marinus]MCA6062151.1 hypothetical protein [Thalassolituus marinus]